MAGDLNGSDFEQMFETIFANVDITNELMFSTIQDEALCMELLEYMLPLQQSRRIKRLKYRQFSDNFSEEDRSITSDVAAQTQETIFGYFGQRGVHLNVLRVGNLRS